MKQSSIILQISALVGVSYAQTQGQGMGIGPSDVSNAVLLNANQHPNATKSVPFTIGSVNFTLTVNVTELTIPANVTTEVQNPRIINSVTGLSWAGDKSLNETIADEEFSHTSRNGAPPPRLCVQFPLEGLFSKSETNCYRESDNGDCTHALGKKCVNAIKNMGATSVGPMCYGGSGPVPREECDLAPWGSFSSGPLINSSASANETAIVPYNGSGFSYWSSDIYPAGNTTRYERETERLQVFIFSNDEGAYPVCVRVKTDHVDGDSPAASGASRSCWERAATSVGLAVSFAVAWVL